MHPVIPDVPDLMLHPAHVDLPVQLDPQVTPVKMVLPAVPEMMLSVSHFNPAIPVPSVTLVPPVPRDLPVMPARTVPPDQLDLPVRKEMLVPTVKTVMTDNPDLKDHPVLPASPVFAPNIALLMVVFSLKMEPGDKQLNIG